MIKFSSHFSKTFRNGKARLSVLLIVLAMSLGVLAAQSAQNPDKTFAASVCGNGIIEAGETCDDGNTVSCDMCSSNCQFESLTCEIVDCINMYSKYQLEGPAFSDLTASVQFDANQKPEVVLNWKVLAQDPTEYDIFRNSGVVGSFFSHSYFSATWTPATSWVDKTVVPGSSYTYGVRSVVERHPKCGVFAKDSDLVSVNIPLPPRTPVPADVIWAELEAAAKTNANLHPSAPDPSIQAKAKKRAMSGASKKIVKKTVKKNAIPANTPTPTTAQ